MSNEIVPYGSGARLPRPIAREMELIKCQALVRVARLHAIEFVTQQAMMSITGLSAFEGRLITMVPLAEPRLAALVDIASMAMVDEVRKFAERAG